MVEYQIVALMVVGSSPIIYPSFLSFVGGIGRRVRLKICSLYKGVGSSPIQSKKCKIKIYVKF